MQINHYSSGSGSELRRFYSNDRDPAIAPELAGILKDVEGLNDYVQIHPAGQGRIVANDSQPVYKPGPFLQRQHAHGTGTGFPAAHASVSGEPRTAGSRPDISGGLGGIEEVDLYNSEAYDVAALRRLSHCCNPLNNPGGSPKETSVAIIGENSMDFNDLSAFAAQYGMAYELWQVEIDSPSCCDSEMTLDIESATAMANSFGAEQNTAQVFAYEGGGTHLTDLLDAWQTVQSDDLARNASTSFGADEGSFGGLDPSISSFTDVINAMAAEGWSMVAATGDHGSTADCSHISVQFPASSPFLVAMGGTTLTLANHGGQPQYNSEVAWTGPGCNGGSGGSTNNGGGGGGCSTIESAGFWQSVTTNSAPCGTKRAIPDIALNAGTGQAYYYLGSWQYFAGTSIAAPAFGGMLAQINSYLLTLGNICASTHDQPCAGFGNPNPAIWFVGGLNSMGGGRNPFYDITSGCNGGDGQTGFCAGPSYDLATGWGSVNIFQLAWIINNYILAPGAKTAQINFSGPPTNAWYNSDQHVSFSITTPPFSGTSASVGVAGYSAQWDAVVPDILTHATPGSGDTFYDGPAKLGSSDYLGLAAAGSGCHTGHVRAWDNIGDETFDETYGPVCYDVDPPVVNCSVPGVVWSPTDVVVPCSASDALSGLANPIDVSFSLHTTVPFGTETANAFTPITFVADLAGNSTPLIFGPFEVDKKAPSIVITAPAATSYAIHQTIDANYACTDGGSGLATCVGTLGNGVLIDTTSPGAKTFSVNATDNVGNAGAQPVSYNVTYLIAPRFNPNQFTFGLLEDIRLQITDFKGVNLSRPNITLTATAVDGDPTKAKPLGFLDPGNKFFFVPGPPAFAFYDYLLDVHKLGAGTHTLSFTVQGDPVVHSVSFNLTK